MSKSAIDAHSVAEAYLALLSARGVEYFFANAGTDFAPIVEAFASLENKGIAAPKPILATHETLATSMAHGYAMVSGQTPTVMVHVGVGTANALCQIVNAARENIPLLFTAGRSPLLEQGARGARDVYIHWAQEMFDQAGMVREFVKWDYELRNSEQLETVVDRALSLARSEPAGPVYLTLPREVLAAEIGGFGYDETSRRTASTVAEANGDALDAAADILSTASHPLILTTSTGRRPEAALALTDLAERLAIPIVQCVPRHISIPSEHPMQLGFDVGPLLPDADVILVVESDVPWIPSRMSPRADARVIHLGLDPLFERYPIRGFPADLAIRGSPASALRALVPLVAARTSPASIEERRLRVATQRHVLQEKWRGAVDTARHQKPIDPAWLSHCIGQAKGTNSIVIDEYPLLLEHCTFDRAGSFYGSSAASGLGWGFGAALGAKLAAPDKLIIATLGEGAYLFSNPVACHHASRLHGLPVLTVIFNNAMWNAVRRATVSIYPNGSAARSNDSALWRLEQLPPFETICEAAGGYGERVEDPAEVEAAIRRAINVVRQEGRQALLNVMCHASDGPL